MRTALKTFVLPVIVAAMTFAALAPAAYAVERAEVCAEAAATATSLATARNRGMTEDEARALFAKHDREPANRFEAAHDEFRNEIVNMVYNDPLAADPVRMGTLVKAKCMFYPNL